MIHGILNVYKEKGFTSHDVVAKLRGITGQRKIGHTGTLDPDAVGVLPVCLGRATKLCDLLTDKDKTYEAVLLLGQETDTQDVSGQILRTGDVSQLTDEQVREAIFSYLGTYEQVPPMYSALKVGGRKLYELAREGKTVERKARRVTIYQIRILECALPRVRMEVTCSKGTYIRTLCHDIGEKLGCCGCMEALIRSRVSSFELKDSHTLLELQERKNSGTLEAVVIPIDTMFSDCAGVVVQKKWESLAYNGNRLPADAVCREEEQEPLNQETVRVYDTSGQFLALYRYLQQKKEYAIVKMFFNQEDRRD